MSKDIKEAEFSTQHLFKAITAAKKDLDLARSEWRKQRFKLSDFKFKNSPILYDLEQQRKQVVIDMEEDMGKFEDQESDEAVKVRDNYGEKLNNIDAQINNIRKKYNR